MTDEPDHTPGLPPTEEPKTEVDDDAPDPDRIFAAMDELRARMEFPTDDVSRYSDGNGPLAPNLRDRFAMAALTGMLGGEWRIEPDRDAGIAYAYADAMLRARS